MMRTTRSEDGIDLKPTKEISMKYDNEGNGGRRYSNVIYEPNKNSARISVPLHTSNTFPYYRRASNKRLPDNSHNIDNAYDHGLMINGSFFDGHLFQPARSSYILDYGDAPKDVNRFLEGHQTSHLDAHLFKLSFILTLSEKSMENEIILDYFPRDENDQEMKNEINFYKRFCFPEFHSNENANINLINDTSTYIFTRILSNGQVEYGYCRRVIDESIRKYSQPIVICIVSGYTYYKLYDAILNELSTAFISNELECNLLIQSFYSKPLPVPTANSSGIVSILNDRRIFFYVCPRDDRLNHDYFSTLISCLSPANLISVFESMLYSKRILCFSKSLSKLTKCCLALSLLLDPFVWPYSFVSLMPSSWLKDLLDSPCPYIYGCLNETISQLTSVTDKEIIRVDLDNNQIKMDFDGQSRLPEDLRETLQNSLEYIVRFRLVKLSSTLINIAVSEAFLRVFTELFHYLPDFFDRLSPAIQHQDSGIDLQSVVSHEETTKLDIRREENRLGYNFQSDEFLMAQPTMAYFAFLNDFIQGMIFLKFLDDYQRKDDKSNKLFSIFAQRLKERRRIGVDELRIEPVTRFRQTFDLLEKQFKQSSRTTNPILSKFMKTFF